MRLKHWKPSIQIQSQWGQINPSFVPWMNIQGGRLSILLYLSYTIFIPETSLWIWIMLIYSLRVSSRSCLTVDFFRVSAHNNYWGKTLIHPFFLVILFPSSFRLWTLLHLKGSKFIVCCESLDRISCLISATCRDQQPYQQPHIVSLFAFTQLFSKSSVPKKNSYLSKKTSHFRGLCCELSL